jgi:hypothetical protein
MAEKAPKRSQPGAKRARPSEPSDPPYEITLPHPAAGDAEPPVTNDPDGAPDLSEGTSPLGDYSRELQREYDEQMEEGKL